MKISIITVCFNSSKTICDTIDSVLKQNYKNIEYILVDGNSKDNTVEIIKKYETIFRKNGMDYIWVSEVDNGIYDAINKGIKMATGDIIGILNSDDLFYDSNTITDVYEIFREDDDIDAIYGNMSYFETINHSRGQV